MRKYNLDKLVKVECNDFCKSSYYEYIKEAKIFGVVIQREGFYDKIFGKYLGMNIPEFHTLKNDVLYEKPKVTLNYQGGYSKIYFFDSLDEAKSFLNKITAIGRWHD